VALESAVVKVARLSPLALCAVRPQA
jgi:hypothetical protein